MEVTHCQSINQNLQFKLEAERFSSYTVETLQTITYNL